MNPEQSKYGTGMTLAACLWLGLFPLLQRGTYAHITRDKWLFMLLLSALTILCFLFDRFRRVPLRKPVSLFPLISASALLLWTVLSCLLSPSSPETWWIAEKARYEGLASQLCYGALFFCFFLSPVRLRPVLYSAAAGVAVFFAVVLLQRAGGNPLGLYPPGTGFAPNPEFQGTIGNVDMDTGYLCLLAGLFLYALAGPLLSGRKSDCSGMSIRLLKGKKALPSAVLLPALLLTLFLIVTMGVQFGVVSLAALVFLTLLRILPKNLRLPALILLLAAVLLIVWFWPGTSGGVWELHEIIHGRSRLSFGSNRIAVWTWSLGLFRESPLLGGGSGTFPERFNRYLAEHGLSVPTEQDGTELPDYFDNPHNEYVARLTDHGLPAALLLICLILSALFRKRAGFLPLLAPCSAAVLCYAVQAFFSFSVCLVAPMFWVVLGLSFQPSESCFFQQV